MKNPFSGRRTQWRLNRSDLARAVKSGIATVGFGTYGDPSILTFKYDPTRLVIGAYTSIGANTTIILGGQHPSDEVTTFPMRIRLGLPGAGSDRHPLPKGDLVIGNDVWIGAGATVLSGIAIGDGAIVGAGSVVSRDVEPYSIVVGNPARVIRKRFSDSQIRDLVEIGWWRWPASVVADRCADLSSQNIDAFIERYRGAPDGRKFTTEPEGRFDPK